jgi:pimeloyl-ACP methyl ester carboxylesterase
VLLENSQPGKEKDEVIAVKEKATWRDPALGVPRELDLPQGRLRYFEAGSGPPIVFVHGLLVNANLWRKVVERLSPEFRCIALELPLGSHTLPMPADADLTPYGLAELIAEALEALSLEQVTLVGNDTGGALCQMLVTRRPERIGRLVLTSCDYRDNFPPRMFRYFKPAAAIPGAMKLLMLPMRLRAPRRLPFAFGWLVTRPIDREAEDSYLLAGMLIDGVERDLKRVIKGLNTRYTNEAADRLREFDKPALIAWSCEDRFFKPAHAERLAQELPNARLEWIENARSLSPEDEPGRLAELIAGFVHEPAARTPANPTRLRKRRPGHSITVLAIAGGSRPARSQPAAAAQSGTPTTARAR